VINPPPAGDKGSVKILGHKVSTDALLLALASVVVIIFLYRKQGGAGVSSSAVPFYNPSGNGVAYAPLPTNTSIASTPPQTPGAAPPANPYANQQQIGAGYGVAGMNLPNVVQTGGSSYAQVNQPYASLLSAGQGQNVYFEAAPGQFLPVTYQVAATGAASGAPLFIKQ
jgi:hypothetical protein